MTLCLVYIILVGKGVLDLDKVNSLLEADACRLHPFQSPSDKHRLQAQYVMYPYLVAHGRVEL
jgi:hypothetical protein